MVIDPPAMARAPPILLATLAGLLPAAVSRLTLPSVLSDCVAPLLTTIAGADSTMFAAPAPPPENVTVGRLE